MKPVFADAFYFVALLNRADQHHIEAAALARQLHNSIVTTDWVLMEVANALADSVNRRSVAPFFRDLAQDPKVKIVPASSDLFRKGLDLYEQRPDKAWTLTDCISFVIMKAEKLTGDYHFQQAGFNPLLGLKPN